MPVHGHGFALGGHSLARGCWPESVIAPSLRVPITTVRRAQPYRQKRTSQARHNLT